jgi:hypothetical protein
MGSIPFISKADETMKAGGDPVTDTHEGNCAGNWREHPQLRTRNASKSFHLSPGVNERIIFTKALTDADYSPQVGQSRSQYLVQLGLPITNNYVRCNR